jgi:hypothetical protein
MARFTWEQLQAINNPSAQPSSPLLQPAPVAPQVNIPSPVNPNSLINPYYMRQQQGDSFSPMRAYQQLKQNRNQNGIMNFEQPSTFTPMPQNMNRSLGAMNTIVAQPSGVSQPSGGGGK